MNAPSTPATSDSQESSFTELQVIGKLGSSRATVYLVHSRAHNKDFAMKLFPYEDDQISYTYLIESRFRSLSHPNIVNIVHTQDKKPSIHQGRKFNASLIIMEVASFGSFTRLFKVLDTAHDEVLTRTFFHHLIEGLEYIHANGVCHMDLKLDNLLLDENLRLKISDFDSSYKRGDSTICSRGTRNYRAPEVLNETCNDPEAADIYSAGIILFVMMTGCFPYKEEDKGQLSALLDLLKEESPAFWDMHAKLSKNKIYLSEDFKILFFSMVKQDSVERATIEDIKKIRWYQGPIYSEKDLKENFLPFLKRYEMTTAHKQ